MILVAIICFGICANAQTRTKIADGLTLVRYGNTSVIEDSKNQQTWNLSVTRERKSTGEWVYYVACGNNYSKNTLKYGLSTAIAGAVAYTGIAAVYAGAAGTLAATFYDDVCKYFGESK